MPNATPVKVSAPLFDNDATAVPLLFNASEPVKLIVLPAPIFSVLPA